MPISSLNEPDLPFLRGGGDMGARIRTFSWTETSLGAPNHWPAGLRVAVRWLLNTDEPAFLFWGRTGVCLYNDAYSRALSPGQHPTVLGQVAHLAWPAIWPLLHLALDSVMKDPAATWQERPLLPLFEHIPLRLVPSICKFGPVDDDASPLGIGGVLVLNRATHTEAPAALAMRQGRWGEASLFDHAPGFMCVMKGPHHVIEYANRQFVQMMGPRVQMGRELTHCLPELERQGLLAILDQVYRSGESYIAQGARLLLHGDDQPGARLRCLDYAMQVLRSDDGHIEAVVWEGLDVTSQTLSMQALSKSERRERERAEELEAVMRQVQACIWIAHDRDCAQITGNRFANQLLGMSENANVSASAQGAATRRFSEYVDGRVAEVHDLPLQKAARTGTVVTSARLSLAFEDGDLRHLLGGAAPLFDLRGQVRGAVAAFVDTTEMVRAQENLAQRELELRTITDNTPDILARFDRDCRVVYVNAAIEAVLDLTPEQAQGRQLKNLGLPQAALLLWEQSLLDAFQTGSRGDIEVQFGQDQPHRLRSFRVRLVPERNARADIAHVLCIIQDVSEEQKSAAALRQAEQRKDEFLATLAHELRNPLAPLRNGLQILRRESQEPELVRICLMMDRQLSHMVRLNDDLLDMSRVTAGKMILRHEVVSLHYLANMAVEAAWPALEAEGHQFELIQPETSIWVYGDSMRLAQVIGNLLSNAAKYTPDGGKVQLTLATESKHAVIRVSDDGMGIPREHQSDVFRMFTQVDHHLHRAQGGMGLGLALAQSIVQLHGGHIEVQSEGLGRGSVFTVQLPLLHSGTVPVRASVDSPPLPPESSASALEDPGLRVLVVDDNEDAADSLVMLLRLSGHEARSVYDSEQALREVQNWHPQVAFLDIGMPGKNGYALAAEIRAQAGVPQPILVALTGWSSDSDVKRSRETGFDHHYTKPVALETLDEVLHSVQAGPAAPEHSK